MTLVLTPHPVEPAEQAPVLDLHAAVHDHLQPGLARPVGGFVVDHAHLHPQHLRTDGDGLLGDRGDLFALAEAVDDIDLLRDVTQAGIALFAEDFRVFGFTGIDAVAVLLHVLGGKIARPPPVGGQAHNGDGAWSARMRRRVLMSSFMVPQWVRRTPSVAIPWQSREQGRPNRQGRGSMPWVIGPRADSPAHGSGAHWPRVFFDSSLGRESVRPSQCAGVFFELDALEFGASPPPPLNSLARPGVPA